MKLPFIKSRNFNSTEIARDAQIADETVCYLTGYVHGHVQGLRDAAYKRFKNKFKGLVITSTNRAAYNQNVKNSAPNSHHIWRLNDKGELHVAYDCKPLGIPLEDFFYFVIELVRGEVYLNKAQGIVHIAPIPMEDEVWIQ